MNVRGPHYALLALLVGLTAPSLRAQEADSSSVEAPAAEVQAVERRLIPADSLAPPPDARDRRAASDTLAADTTALRLPLSAYAPVAGRLVGPVPATQPGLSVGPLLGEVPGTFLYDLGTPGWPDGLSFGGRAPRRAMLTLDGLPLTDLVTGRPRYDWLPLELLGRLAREPVALGETATHAAVRPLDAPVARTELRYVTGQEGAQIISATHAQTRRPGFVGREGRLGVLFHVGGQQADGLYTGSEVSSYRVLGRVTVNRPGWALAVTEHRARLQVGAHGPVSGAIYDAFNATVPDADTERTDVVHLLSARLRAQTPLFAEPVAVIGFRMAQTARYGRTGFGLDDPPIEVEVTRVGLAVAQPLALGPHHFAVRATAWRDAALDSTSAAAVPASEARSFASLVLTDSTVLAGIPLRLGLGLDRTPEGTAPTGYAAAAWQVGTLHLDASFGYGGPAYGRAEVGGYVPDSTDGTALRASAAPGDERTAELVVGFRYDLGAFRVGLRTAVVVRSEARLLLADAPTEDGAGGATFATLPGALRRAIVTGALAFRPDAQRGVYAAAEASVQQVVYDGDTGEATEAADVAVADRAGVALPDAWGRGRLGFRALGVFDDVLDLDVAVRGQAWLGFASRTFHAPTALFALPTASTIDAPAGGTLGLTILARLQKRASLYVTYDHALGERAVAGTFLVPVYPLTPHHLRFGVFWTLFG